MVPSHDRGPCSLENVQFSGSSQKIWSSSFNTQHDAWRMKQKYSSPAPCFWARWSRHGCLNTCMHEPSGPRHCDQAQRGSFHTNQMKLDFRAKRGRADAIPPACWLCCCSGCFLVIFVFEYYNYSICLLFGFDSLYWTMMRFWSLFLKRPAGRVPRPGVVAPSQLCRHAWGCMTANASINGSWLNWHNNGRKWLSITFSFHMCHAAAVCTHWWEAEQTFAPQKKKIQHISV